MEKQTTDNTSQKASLPGGRESIFGSQSLVAFVATLDPSRAKMFYRDTLGLALISEDEFALVFDAAGEIVKTTKGLQKVHVTLERYPGMQQNELGHLEVA